jgi:hypothetical protein
VGALLAASMTAWLHQLTGLAAGEDMLAGAGGRGGKAMIATLRRRLIAVLGRLTRHARHLVLRIPPGTTCCPRCQPGCESCPHPADLRTRALRSPPSATARQPDSQEGLRTANPARLPGRQHARGQESRRTKVTYRGRTQPPRYSRIRG